MLLRLFHTIKYLKFIQIYYQIFYRLKRKTSPTKYKSISAKKANNIKLLQSIPKQNTYLSSEFIFINKVKKFKSIKEIDWDYSDLGKLWTYNLNYFDFLNQQKQESPEIIIEFIKKLPKLKTAIEPYPISLRGINWIKYLSKNKLEIKTKQTIENSLYSQYKILYKNLEYHLLGNHLLENAISLLFGAFYFNCIKWYKKASKILFVQLKEQILPDGGHFELSPMYHSILLDRLMDTYNLLTENSIFLQQDRLNRYLKKKITLMLAWLKQVSFSSGDIPLFNDSTFGIAPTLLEIEEYANRLRIVKTKVELKESGIRSINFGKSEIKLDIGQIGPDYIPGHAHSDTFGFEMYYQKKPILVDTGTSTYEKNQIRQTERQTESHNTVQIEDLQQSDVWGGHKVGKRAKIKIIKDTPNHIIALHSGYKKSGVVHKREWLVISNNICQINDYILGKKKKAFAFLHFHPECNIKIKENIVFADHIKIEIMGLNRISKNKYEYAPYFNTRIKSICVVVEFEQKLETKIFS